MTNQSQNPTLRVGDSVFVPVHSFIKELLDTTRGDEFMHAFYGSTGTVVKTHMVEEGIPNYALVHFDSNPSRRGLCLRACPQLHQGVARYHAWR